MDDVVERTAALHDKLHVWLLASCDRDTEMLAVLGALTYEIGLCVGRIEELQGSQMSETDLMEMLDGIRNTMRDQVQAYRRGLRT